MDTLRLHVVLLLCGTFLAGSIALGLIGMQHRGVRDEMLRQLQIARQISTLTRAPQNERTVAMRKRRQEDVAREVAEMRAAVRRINKRELLLSNAFNDSAPPCTPYRFAELYRDTIDGFPAGLCAGGLPSPAEVAAAEAELADRAADRRERDAELLTGRGGRLPPQHRAVSVDAVQFANLSKARSIRCYAERDSFDVSPLYGSPRPPSVKEMWFAQVGLWIQQDVVSAIAELNAQSACSLKTPAGTEDMPVKRILHLYVLGYLLEEGLLPFPAPDLREHDHLIPIRASLTGQVCNELFDVVLFRVMVIADQRDLLQLIDRITRQNFFSCTGVSYAAVPQTDIEQGYCYGREPAIEVALEFEAYMVREIYHPTMPAEVRALLAVE